MSHSWKHSWSLLCNKCDINGFILWRGGSRWGGRQHLHDVAFTLCDKYTFSMLHNCLVFPYIWSAKTWDAQRGIEEKHRVCLQFPLVTCVRWMACMRQLDTYRCKEWPHITSNPWSMSTKNSFRVFNIVLLCFKRVVFPQNRLNPSLPRVILQETTNGGGGAAKTLPTRSCDDLVSITQDIKRLQILFSPLKHIKQTFFPPGGFSFSWKNET